MLDSPPRILVVSEIPTPYRLPLFERLASRTDLRLELVFCAAEEPDRPWKLDAALAGLPHRILRGVAVPVRTRHNTFVYELNPGIVGVLFRARHDLIVVGGYSVFAEQVAIAVARARRIPYLLHSESTLLHRRASWVRAVKDVLVRPVIANAAAGLAVGSAAREYLVHYGLPAHRIRIVPNTIDVAAYATKAAAARAEAKSVRARLGLPEKYVLFAGRLVEVKGLLDLVAAVELLGESAPQVVVAGEGPLSDELARSPALLSVGFVQRDTLIELFALASWTVVPSRFEPWGVVVNEALACDCPVIVSDAVGAAVDLVEDGVNGHLVPAGDPHALARALVSTPPTNPDRTRIDAWNYDFAVDQFLEGVNIALR